MAQEDILIKGGRLMTMAQGQPDEVPGSVLIRRGKIEALLPPSDHVEGVRVIDAQGKFVLPGFIDTHRHTWQTQL
jgi:5-methylthioadenosine/S-adenosylhomocysteine deaminase